jgi:hypothetical protein
MRKLLLLMLVAVGLPASAATIKFFTDYPNSVPVGSDFFVFQRNQSYINASVSQVKGDWFNNPVFTGVVTGITNISFITVSSTTNINQFDFTTNLFVNNSYFTNVTIEQPGGLTNLNLNPKTVMYADVNDAEASIPNASGVLTNDGAGGIGFNNKIVLDEIDALNFFPTNFFTGLTNYSVLGTDANGLLTLGSSTTNLTVTNLTVTTIYASTNFSTNSFFVSGKGNTLIITNTLFVTNGISALNLNPNQFVASDANDKLVSTLNGNTLTNLLLSAIVSPTNGVSTASSIDFSLSEALTNVAGAVSQTSFINANPTNINHAIRYYVNRTGSDQTITVGAWETDSARQTPTTYINTNNTTLALMYSVYFGQFTNVTAYKTFR